MAANHSPTPDRSLAGAAATGNTNDGDFAVFDAPPSVWPHFLVGQSESPVRVLLVDDDAHILRVMSQELMADARTMVVAQASSVREGRRAIKQHDFDVMLVDVNLGDGEGFELLDYMKTMRPKAEAVLVSAIENDEQVLRAFEMGATGFLLKNSWFGNYPQAVLQVANGGAAITPTLARRLLQRFDPNHVEAPKAPAAVPAPVEQLTIRETDVLRLVASGYTSAEIAEKMEVSSVTVNTYVRNIYRKFQLRTRAQAVRFASLRGLL